jgi:phosphatidylserine decarboxylase
VTRESAREARRYVAAAALVELILAPLRVLRGRLLLGTGLGCLFFFRDPSRSLDPEPDTIYAPADGVVVGVETARDDWLAGDALRISTFLALWDVHVNRSPVSGRIALADETPGGFAPAFLARASRNRRKRLAIDDGARRVVLVQIAGLLARKVSSWAWRGDAVTAGQRIALIHFGSRAEVLVPAAEARPLVDVGQRVRAGITPVARFAAARSAA